MEFQYLRQEEVAIDDDLVVKIYNVLKQNNVQPIKEASLIKQISEEARSMRRILFNSLNYKSEYKYVEPVLYFSTNQILSLQGCRLS